MNLARCRPCRPRSFSWITRSADSSVIESPIEARPALGLSSRPASLSSTVSSFSRSSISAAWSSMKKAWGGWGAGRGE